MELEDFIDKKLENVDLSAMEKVFGLACRCLHERKAKRPSMAEVSWIVLITVHYIDLTPWYSVVVL